MMNGGKRKIELIEYVGLFLVAFSFLMLVVNPGGIGNLFNNMFNHAAPIRHWWLHWYPSFSRKCFINIPYSRAGS